MCVVQIMKNFIIIFCLLIYFFIVLEPVNIVFYTLIPSSLNLRYLQYKNLNSTTPVGYIVSYCCDCLSL
jgi:hypothetical protein